MVKFLKKILLSGFFWGVFAYVIYTTPYPESLTLANIIQISSFFIPLFFAMTFSLNVFFKNFLVSSSISSGLIFLLILKGLNSLNIVTGALIIISTGLLVSYFKKLRKRNLTKLPKIPKLTQLRKQ